MGYRSPQTITTQKTTKMIILLLNSAYFFLFLFCFSLSRCSSWNFLFIFSRYQFCYWFYFLYLLAFAIYFSYASSIFFFIYYRILISYSYLYFLLFSLFIASKYASLPNGPLLYCPKALYCPNLLDQNGGFIQFQRVFILSSYSLFFQLLLRQVQASDILLNTVLASMKSEIKYLGFYFCQGETSMPIFYMPFQCPQQSYFSGYPIFHNSLSSLSCSQFHPLIQFLPFISSKAINDTIINACQQMLSKTQIII